MAGESELVECEERDGGGFEEFEDNPRFGSEEDAHDFIKGRTDEKQDNPSPNEDTPTFIGNGEDGVEDTLEEILPKDEPKPESATKEYVVEGLTENEDIW